MLSSGKRIKSAFLALVLVAVLSFAPVGSVYAAAPIKESPIGGTVLGNVTFGGKTYAGTVDENFAWQVLDLINQERAKQGIAPLTMDAKLYDTAVGRSAELTTYFSHTRPNGTSCFTAFPSGLSARGENIAAGYQTPASVVNAWMNSSGHRANILDSGYRAIGIGCVKTSSGYGLYWTQDFGDRVLQAKVRPGAYVRNGIDYSAVFDADYYLSKNADVKKAFGTDKTKAFEHFLNYGMKEGRRASASFDVQSYKNKYADLRSAFGNDLRKYYEHYAQYGKKEGRTATGVTTLQGAVTKLNGVDYSAVYNFNYYQQKNSDIKKAFGNDDVKTLQHFVNYGMKEGRRASASFDVWSYKNKYPDLRAAFGNDLKKYYTHYMNYGKREGRIATGVATVQGAVTKLNGVDYSAVYDFNYYQNKYADIKKAFGNDDVKTLQHFVNYGMREGRQGKANFNVTIYKNKYADLRKAFGNDNQKYYIHYINYGKKEGRKGSN